MAAQPAANGGLSIDGIRAIYGIPQHSHDSAYANMKPATRSLARPNTISDTYRVSKMKTKYRIHRGECLPFPECTCAVSSHCLYKPGGEHDCRSLAPKPKPAHESGWQDPGHRVETHLTKDIANLVQSVRYFGVLAQDIRVETANFPQLHGYVRKWLSDMRCLPTTDEILARSNILQVISKFLRWVSANAITFRRVPYDVRSDLTWLKRKWAKGDYSLSDPLRGIVVSSNGPNRSLDKSWEFYNPNWDCFGNNGLISGESWPFRITLMRDGGHGSPEAGISGIMGEGATSIILSNPEKRDEYADWDMGERIGYVGTSGLKDSPTRSTQFLLDSHKWFVSSRKIKQEGSEMNLKDVKDDRPVRVFRSHKLPPHNQWRPENGFRYDGLYDVVDQELIDTERALYRFTMERRPSQGPLRVDQPDNQTLLLWYQCAAVQKTAD